METKLEVSSLMKCLCISYCLQVTYHRPLTGRGRLEFGTVEMKRNYSLLFTVRNDNPVPVSCAVDQVGCGMR